MVRIPTTDSWPIDGARIDDLDMTLIQRHITVAQSEGRYSGLTDPLTYLRYNQLVTDSSNLLVPTLAGVLAFALEPERWLLASSGIDIAEFSTNAPRTTNLKFIEQIRGSIFTVVDRAVDLLWHRTEHGYHIEGAQRVEEHAYPRLVLRELTVNALCHRDWSNQGSRVRIHIFPNSIEWISPGGLPEGVTIDNLLDAQSSRNPALVNIMFQAHYIEGLGLGFDSVYSALAESGVEPPQIRNSENSLSIRVLAKAIDTRKVENPTPLDRQQAILTLVALRDGASITDLEEALGIQRRTIQRDLQILTQASKLVVVGATNRRRYYLAKS